LDTLMRQSSRTLHTVLLLLLGLILPLAPTPTRASGADPAGISIAALRLTATMNSVGVEVPFTGDANRSATASIEFRRVGDSTWRAGLPLWPTYDPTGAAFYGSALLLSPGSQYEVRVTIADADGVTGSAVQSSTITTRADSIPAPETLTPTYYVR